MLEGVADLTLAQLNEATLAWVEMEYNRTITPKPARPPLHRYLHDKRCRPALSFHAKAQTGLHHRSSDALNAAATARSAWKESVSKSLPVTRIWKRLTVRYASWDLSSVYLVRSQTGAILCRLFPSRQTEERRRGACRQENPLVHPTLTPPPPGMAPLLRKTHPTVRHHRIASGLSAQTFIHQ